MTNAEKYKDELIKILLAEGRCDFGISGSETDVITSCYSAQGCKACKECRFSSIASSCTTQRIKWLNQEYQENRIAISKDTKIDTLIQVSNDGVTWEDRFFYKFDGGRVICFSKNHCSFTFDGLHSNTAYWLWARPHPLGVLRMIKCEPVDYNELMNERSFFDA